MSQLLCNCCDVDDEYSLKAVFTNAVIIIFRVGVNPQENDSENKQATHHRARSKASRVDEIQLANVDTFKRLVLHPSCLKFTLRVPQMQQVKAVFGLDIVASERSPKSKGETVDLRPQIYPNRASFSTCVK
jgi:hypothetical protein